MARQPKYPHIPKVEPGWKTDGMMVEAYGGDITAWKNRMSELRDRLIKEKMREVESTPREEAESIVEHKWIGMRKPLSKGGYITLAASPQAQERLLSELALPLGAGWKTSMMMRKTYGGAHSLWNSRMSDLAQEFAQDIVEQLKLPMAEAHKIVEHNLIGMRRPVSGIAGIAASPEAQRILLERLPPELGPGWKTSGGMQRDFGGSKEIWRGHMEQLRKELIQDIAQQLHLPTEEAGAMVEHSLIGDRRPSSGRKGLAASPDAQRLLAEKYPVRKISRKSERETPDGDLSR